MTDLTPRELPPHPQKRTISSFNCNRPWFITMPQRVDERLGRLNAYPQFTEGLGLLYISAWTKFNEDSTLTLYPIWATRSVAIATAQACLSKLCL